MTIRLDPSTRRKIERLAEREGISLNQALVQLLQRAPDADSRSRRQRRYRLRPRKVGFGFDTASAKRLAADLADERILSKWRGRRFTSF